jgi:hypothetical protein
MGRPPKRETEMVTARVSVQEIGMMQEIVEQRLDPTRVRTKSDIINLGISLYLQDLEERKATPGYQQELTSYKRSKLRNSKKHRLDQFDDEFEEAQDDGDLPHMRELLVDMMRYRQNPPCDLTITEKNNLNRKIDRLQERTSGEA